MWRHHLKLNFVVFVWSFTAILGKLMTMPRFELVFLRTLLAGLLLGSVLAWRGSRFATRRNRGGGVQTRLSELKRPLALFANGMIIGLHWVLFFTAAAMNASVCLAGLATTTLWTAILQPLMLRHRWSTFELLLGALIAAALGLMYRFQGHGSALLTGLGAAVAAAVFSIINGRIARDEDPIAVTVVEMAGASTLCLVALSAAMTSGHIAPESLLPPLMDWVWMTVLVVLCTAYAFVAYVSLLRELSVFTINLAANFEPVYGMILAAILLGEHKELSFAFYLSSSVIVGCVVVHTVATRRRFQP